MLRIFDKTGAEIGPDPSGQQAAAGSTPIPKPAGEILPVWYDLLNPTVEEIQFVETALTIQIPSRDELGDIEPSSRLYIENDAIYLTASLAYRIDSSLPGLTDTGFILVGGKLVTIRHAEPSVFKVFVNQFTKTTATFNGATDILLHLLEAIVDRAAEILEGASRDVDNVTTTVFHTEAESRPDRATRDLEARLSEVATLHRQVAKVRESLITLSRAIAFLQAQPNILDTKPLKDKCKSVARDIPSLAEHAGFIAANITFLLDACLGLISVQQNNVMKIFSIFAVILLPPTFIGSVYGMNFDFMPELHWKWGYLAVLSAMFISGVVPIMWFRKKGWM